MVVLTVVHEVILLCLCGLIIESQCFECSSLCQVIKSPMVCACDEATSFPVCARLPECEAICRAWVIDDNKCRLEGDKLVMPIDDHYKRSGRSISEIIAKLNSAPNIFEMWQQIVEWIFVPPFITGIRSMRTNPKKMEYLETLYKSIIAV